MKFSSIIFSSIILLLGGNCARARYGVGPKKPADSAPLPISEQKQGDAEDLCLSTHKTDCDELKRQLAELRDRRDADLKSNDTDDLNRTMLEMNYRLEKLRLLKSALTSTADLDQLEQKYTELRRILEQAIAAKLARPPRHEAPQGQDIAGIVYHELEVKAVAEVMNTFGDLYIQETSANAQSKDGALEYSVAMPWSSYWYPVTGSELFDTESSPLQKFDRATNANSAIWERNHHLQSGETWEGLCGAWSVAAIMTKEPSKPIHFHGETFTISDQKALLTKAYERFPTKNYGNRYNGDEATDGTRADIRPEAFHRIAEVFLRDRKAPFIIDDTAGIEVWNKPVYRIRWRIIKDPNIANAFLVKAWPWLVRQRYDIKNDLTGITDRYAPAPYEYRLYVLPTKREDGKQKVIAGEWLNDSIENHPDYVMVPDQNGHPQSANPELNERLETLLTITDQK